MAFEYKEFPLTLDLVEGTSAQSSNKKISLSQRDIGVSKILFSLTFRNVSYPIPAGAKIRLFIKRYNSGIVMQDQTPETGAHVVVTDAPNGKIEVLLNTESIATPGQAEAQIEIELAAGKIMTSQKFNFFIEAALGANGEIISGNDIPMLDKALEVGEKFKNTDLNAVISVTNDVQQNKSNISILDTNIKDFGMNLKAQGFKGDGTAGDLQKLNDLINNAPSNTRFLLPDGTYKLNGAMATLTNGKILEGIGKPTLDFSTAPDGITAVKVDTKRLQFASGIQNVVIKGAAQAGTQKGLDLRGKESEITNVEIVYFGTGLYLSNSNMYINTFEKVWIHRCGKGVQFPDDTLTPGITDCGENLRFLNCNISDNTVALVGGLTTTDAHFQGCSIDYNVKMSELKAGFYNFYGGHIESTIATSPQNYMFDVLVGFSPTFSFHGTTISAYGIQHLFNPDPAIRGLALFYGVNGYANGSSNNSDKAMKSQVKVVIPPGQTSATTDNFLATSQLSMISAKVYILGGQTADIATANIIPTLSLAAGKNTITVNIPTAQAKNTFIMVTFG